MVNGIPMRIQLKGSLVSHISCAITLKNDSLQKSHGKLWLTRVLLQFLLLYSFFLSLLSSALVHLLMSHGKNMLRTWCDILLLIFSKEAKKWRSKFLSCFPLSLSSLEASSPSCQMGYGQRLAWKLIVLFRALTFLEFSRALRINGSTCSLLSSAALLYL